MRLTLTIIALLAACAAFADGDENDQQQKQTQRYEVTLSTDELVQGIDGLADVLEDKLDGPTRVYYEAAVNRRIVTASTWLVFASICAVVCVVLFTISMGAICQSGRDDDITGWSVGVGVDFIGFVFACISIANHYISLQTADYEAMRDIIYTASQFVR